VSDGEKLGLIVLLVGLGLISGKVSAKLAKETGLSTLLIAALAGAAGHGLSNKL